MNEEIKNILNGDAAKNQGGKNVDMDKESSVVGGIFTVLAWLNLIFGIANLIIEANKYYNRDYALGFTLLGSSLFLFAVASCLKFLAKISSRMGRIMKALEK